MLICARFISSGKQSVLGGREVYTRYHDGGDDSGPFIVRQSGCFPFSMWLQGLKSGKISCIRNYKKNDPLKAVLHAFLKDSQRQKRPSFLTMEATASQTGPPRSFGGAGKALQNPGNNFRPSLGYSHGSQTPIVFGTAEPENLPVAPIRASGQLPDSAVDRSRDDPLTGKHGRPTQTEISRGEQRRHPHSGEANNSSGSPLTSALQTPVNPRVEPPLQDPQKMSPAMDSGSGDTWPQRDEQYESDFPALGAVPKGSAKRQGWSDIHAKPKAVMPALRTKEEQMVERASQLSQADVPLPSPGHLAQEKNVSTSSAPANFSAPQSVRPARRNQTTRAGGGIFTHEDPQIISKHAETARDAPIGSNTKTEHRRPYRQRRNQQDGPHYYDREADLDALGRMLTRILRHRALDYNLKIRSDGFVEVSDILSLAVKTATNKPLRTYTTDDVLKAVEQNQKQRLGTKTEDGKQFIRANQGHTLEAVATEDLLKPITSANEVPVCVHGTFMRNKNAILREGLKRMTRRHVHFATGEYGSKDVISGMRRTCDVLIYLNVEAALSDGMKFYISENGVLLTEGFDGVVPVKYFTKVEDLKSGKPISFAK